jgi:hypothetical protein
VLGLLSAPTRLNSCITNKGGVPNSCFQGEFLHQEKEKLGEMHFFRGSFASMKTKIGRNAFVS